MNISEASRAEMESGAGTKDDGGKLRYDLVPPEALAEWVRVLTVGAEKYEDRNWERGMGYGRAFAALNRHAQAWWAGERDDPETRVHHMAAVMFNAAALLTWEMRGVGEDSRPGTARALSAAGDTRPLLTIMEQEE